METFSALLALCEGSHQSPVVSLHKSQWRGALMLYLMNKRLSKQSRCRWFETSRPLCCYFSRYLQPQCQMGHNFYIASKFDVSHYSDVLMRAMAHQITCVSIVCSTVCSGADQRKTSKHRVIGLCEGNHWSPVDSTHKGPVTRKMFLFGDIIM